MIWNDLRLAATHHLETGTVFAKLCFYPRQTLYNHLYYRSTLAHRLGTQDETSPNCLWESFVKFHHYVVDLFVMLLVYPLH